MSRKAVTMAFVMAMVLLLVVLVALLLFLNKTFQKVESQVPEEKCRLGVSREVVVNAITKQAGAGHTAKDFASNIECQTVPVEIRTDDASEIAGIVVDAMKNCWRIFGNGENELFSSGKGSFCHACYVLHRESGSQINLRQMIVPQRLGTLAGNYDVPEQFGTGNFGIIFSYALSDGSVSRRLHVVSFDPEKPAGIEACRDAEFPKQRST